MSSVPAWVWLASGWCVIALGVLVLVRGRWRWVRLRGRVCPRCRYDMAGLDSLRCPECGRTGRSERDLRPRGAKKRWRLVGAALVPAGWALVNMPSIMAGGWVGAAPDWMLARVAPVAPPPSAWFFSGMAPPAPATNSTLTEVLWAEIWRRLDGGTFGEPSAGVYLRRCIADATNLESAALPKAWPVDKDLPRVELKSRNFRISAALDFEYTDLTRTGVSRTLRARAGTRLYTLATERSDIDVTRSSPTFMRPVTSPELDARISATFRPTVYVKWEKFWLEFRTQGLDAVRAAADLPYVWVEVQILLDGEVLGAGHCDLSYDAPADMLASVSWIEGGHERAIAAIDRLEVDLQGNTQRPVADYVIHWTRAPSAWAGHLRVKPTVEPAAGR